MRTLEIGGHFTAFIDAKILDVNVIIRQIEIWYVLSIFGGAGINLIGMLINI